MRRDVIDSGCLPNQYCSGLWHTGAWGIQFMDDVANDCLTSGKKPFVKPELVELDVLDTRTGVPDPNEFNPFIGPTS